MFDSSNPALPSDVSLTQPSAGQAEIADAYERQRVQVVRRTKLLDTPSSEAFDQITRLASQMFSAPVALVSLVDSERQWFKSRHGMQTSETDREFAFCSHAIERNEVMVVEDATKDLRFLANPFVTGPTAIRFYAGAPLILPSGHALGTICVLDHEPRTFSELQRAQLATLATFVLSQIELHRQAGRVNEITRLPNRTQMADDIEGLILSEPGETRGMLLVDVIDHHRLEDTVRALGIEPLEITLRDIAVRLRSILGPEWPMYHVSTTRFCIQMRGDTRAERDAFSSDLLAKLETPFDSGGVSLQLEVAAGLVDFELTEHGGADALRKATAALHEATARGNKYRWHDSILDSCHARAYRLMREISGGLTRGEFRLVYQPKLNLTAKGYTGVEALARWRHPEYGDVSPGEFIPLVEQTALIHEFTRWALKEALTQTAEWQKQGLNLTVAVNVSSRNLDEPGFVEDVKRICASTQVDAKWLHVECTENAVLNSEETRVALTELRSMGAQVSLDDFGMGYSNLSCLRRLPVQLLKLDQSLIKPIDSDPASYELVKSLILLGHSLGFRMLAEGVETQRACEMLIEAGCDAMQGYYLGRPMEADAIQNFIANPIHGGPAISAAPSS